MTTYNTSSINRIDVRGGAGNNTITIETNASNPIGTTGVNKTTKIFGDSGDDTINGGDLADEISGELGNDTIDGRGGSDVLNGGYAGDDTADTSGNDTITGGAGTDAMYGGPGDDEFHAFDGGKPTAMTILFVWELGGGLGHLMQMLPLAEDLVRAGHRVFVAFRDLDRAGPIYSVAGVSFLQAPIWLSGAALFARPMTYAQMLANCGYGSNAALFARACA